MNIKKKRFSLLIAFLTITLVIFSQQVGSNSPYGRYGYGVLSNPSIGASEAMGGISYGFEEVKVLIPETRLHTQSWTLSPLFSIWEFQVILPEWMTVLIIEISIMVISIILLCSFQSLKM